MSGWSGGMEGRIENLDGKTREGWVGGGAGARRAEMGRTDNGGVDSFPAVAGFGRGLNEASYVRVRSLGPNLSLLSPRLR